MKRAVFLGSLMTMASAGVLVMAQQDSAVPQPRASALPAPGQASPKPSRTIPKPDGVMPTVPEGFTVTTYAELQAPRMMVYAPNGDLFVSSPNANTIVLLRDANNDGTFEACSVFAAGEVPGAGRGGGRGGAVPPPAVPPGCQGPLTNPNAPPPAPAAAAPAPAAGGQAPPQARQGGPGGGIGPGGAAPGVAPGAAPGGGAPRAGGPPPQGFGGGGAGRGGPPIEGANAKACSPPPEFAPEELMVLPAGGDSTRTVRFNRAGTKMYIAVGSQSNNDAGEDCRRAAILEFNPDGSGYRVYASGIRNPVGLALQPGTDIIWTAMNERDNLGDDLVPDYATSVKDGGFYGWPYSYIGSTSPPRYVGAFPDLVKKALVPDVLLPAHAAALGITFYTGNQFPQRYRNGGFVALHGSWNRSVAAGYKVVFFPMNNGKPGPMEDFLTGFLASTGANNTPIETWGRPVGVLTARDGSLLVSDDGANRIWKISATKK